MTRHAWTIEEFCQSHGISRATFYNLLKRGYAPRIMKVGARTLISIEAASDWREHMERATTELGGR
jgi:predicted DNA-binding transcriptional regulator AlpA